MDKEINNRLKVIRNHLQITQREMAEKLDVRQSYYSDVENGRRTFTVKLLDKVVRICGISKDWIYTGKGIMIDTKINKSNDDLRELLQDRLRNNTIIKNENWQNANLIVTSKIRKVEFYYQRIVDIKILLWQELQVKEKREGNKSYENKSYESEMMHNVFKDNSLGMLRSSYSTLDELQIFGRELDSLIDFFEERFFMLFKILYKGLRKDLGYEYQVPEFID